MTKTLKAMIKRRSAIKPAIGHMKMDGRPARNPLQGALGGCAARRDVRRRGQPAPDPGRAAASLRPDRAAYAGGYRRADRDWTRQLQTAENGIVQGAIDNA